MVLSAIMREYSDILRSQMQVVWRLDAYTRSEAQEYETVKQNVDALLSIPKGQEQQQELE